MSLRTACELWVRTSSVSHIEDVVGHDQHSRREERAGREVVKPRGRAFAGFDVLWQSGRMLSLLGGGLLADAVGIREVYLLGGLLLLAAPAIGAAGARAASSESQVSYRCSQATKDPPARVRRPPPRCVAIAAVLPTFSWRVRGRTGCVNRRSLGINVGLPTCAERRPDFVRWPEPQVSASAPRQSLRRLRRAGQRGGLRLRPLAVVARPLPMTARLH